MKHRKSSQGKALRIYDLLREAHKSIKKIWRDHPDLIFNADGGEAYGQWESAVDAVDKTLYLAEHFFVTKGKEASQ